LLGVCWGLHFQDSFNFLSPRREQTWTGHAKINEWKIDGPLETKPFASLVWRIWCGHILRAKVPESILPTQIIPLQRIACIYWWWTPEFKFVVTFHHNDLSFNVRKLKLIAVCWA
jgi:hypothetical protein